MAQLICDPSNALARFEGERGPRMPGCVKLQRPNLLEALEQYDYPGNVRELRNRIERAVALAHPGEPLSARHLGGLGGRAAPMRMLRSGTLRERVERVEIESIRDALARFDGNRTRVAEALGLSRTGLREKMKRLGLGDLGAG